MSSALVLIASFEKEKFLRLQRKWNDHLNFFAGKTYVAAHTIKGKQKIYKHVVFVQTLVAFLDGIAEFTLHAALMLFGRNNRPSDGSLLISPLSFNVLVYTHVSCGCIHEDAFFPTAGEFNFFQRMDGSTSTCGWMPGCGFPRLKGRTNLSLFFFFDCLVALVKNR
ncbi:hypothetical protein DAPPUDRAFT_98227 [Daphnia pulex]|uniref:Uncharacterized protein n=1 Tax=Daphnia pulex TaxID=6669 RepID=E9G457_DAPPU|nr:hypothetical protein DAPPUDRAFT_98227 [Daphnia pulex]|eukprot:EFX85696.1 hypothetical protein DAPPUDRAFT_98227 [Daphnia pulex]